MKLIEDHWDKVIVAFVSLTMISLTVVAYLGIVGPEMVTAVGTAVLAIATAVYATEAYKNRVLTRETLRERNKNRIIETIIYGIDPLRASVDEVRSEFDSNLRGQSNADPTELEPIWYSKPPTETLPEDEKISDIEQKSPGILEEVQSFRSYLDRYDELWADTKAELKEEFPDGEALSPIHQAIEKVGERYDPGFDDSPITKLDGIRDAEFAYLVLYLDADEVSTKGWMSDNWDLLEPAFRDVRSSEQFRGQFGEMERTISAIDRTGQQIIEMAEGARQEYKEEYGIMESEIEAVRSR